MATHTVKSTAFVVALAFLGVIPEVDLLLLLPLSFAVILNALKDPCIWEF